MRKFRIGLIIALLGALLATAKDLFDKFKVPGWVFITIVLTGCALTIAGIVREQINMRNEEVAKDRQKRADWQRKIDAMLAVGPPIPKAKAADALAIGVSSSLYARDAKMTPYVPRSRVDSSIRTALTSYPFIIVIGPSKAGKSRTAFEAMRKALPDWQLVVPRAERSEVIWELFALERPEDLVPPLIPDPPLTGSTPSVLWLDDLERFLGPGGLESKMIDRWNSHHSVVVLATMRTDEHNKRRREMSSVRPILGRAHEIFMNRMLDDDERRRAMELYPTIDFTAFGIGECMVAAGELVRTFEASIDFHPIGYALVRAAADWSRVGLTGGIPEEMLKVLHVGYLPSYPGPANRESFEEALQWACETAESSVPILIRRDGVPTTFELFDYLVSYIDNDERFRSIPEATWEILTANQPVELIQVSFASYGRTAPSVIGALRNIINTAETAVAESPESALALADLGAALHQRYLVAGNAEDLEASIASTARAITLTPSDSPELVNLLQSIAATYGDRYQRNGSLEDLGRSIDAIEHAIAVTSPSSRELAGLFQSVGAAYSDRYMRTDSQDDLERGLDYLRRSVSITPESSPELPVLLARLAYNYTQRYLLSRSNEDLTASTETFSQACEFGMRIDPAQVLEPSASWGDWAAGRGSWSEAADAYSFGLEAVLRLVERQPSEQDKQNWLRKGQGFGAQAAYAYARQGAVADAIVTLEKARAVLMRERLDTGLGGTIEQLAQVDPGLTVRLRKVTQRLAELEANSSQRLERTTEALTTLRAARAEADEIVTQIRALPGFDRFLLPLVIDDIVAGLRHPLVYIATTRHGGVACVADQLENMHIVWLPDLLEDELRERMNRSAIESSGFSDELMQWIWDTAIGPLIETLSSSTNIITLVPGGLLGLLPLHAAWTRDESMMGGRRYAIDMMTFTYVASARALTAANALASRSRGNTLLSVAPSSDLPATQEELVTVARMFDHSILITGVNATKSKVIEELTAGNIVIFHFAGYGLDSEHAKRVADVGLVLSSREVLTAREIAELRLPPIRLVVLNAGSAARIGVELTDEVIGLPSAFVQAGAAGVVAPLWNVSDIGGEQLVRRFLDALNSGVAPALALRMAQLELRESPEGRRDDTWAAYAFIGA